MSIKRENSESRANHSRTAQPARRISTNAPGEGLPHPVATRPRGELEYAPRCVDPYSLDSRLLGSNNARLKTTVQELRDKLAESQRAANQEKDRLSESFSTSISINIHVSLTPMTTRRQNHSSRTDDPRTAGPTCRFSTQSRGYQPCTRAEASMRIPVCSRSCTEYCEMSSRADKHYK